MLIFYHIHNNKLTLKFTLFLTSLFLCFQKKTYIQPPPRAPLKNESFFLKIKKCLECSETIECEQIFVQGYPLKTFPDIFLEY